MDEIAVSTPTPKRRGKGKKTLAFASYFSHGVAMPYVVMPYVAMPPVVTPPAVTPPAVMPPAVMPAVATSSLADDAATVTSTPRRRGKGRKYLRNEDGSPVVCRPFALSSPPMYGEMIYGGMDSQRAMFDATVLQPPGAEREALKEKLIQDRSGRFNKNVLTIVAGSSSSSSTNYKSANDFVVGISRKRQKSVVCDADPLVQARAADEKLKVKKKNDKLRGATMQCKHENIISLDAGDEDWGVSHEELYDWYKDTGHIGLLT